MKFNEKVAIDIAGLGFIIYSEGAVEHIKEGEKYLENHYWNGVDVVRSINEGKIIGISTGSPGKFYFEVIEGEPSADECEGKDFIYQVPIVVDSGRIIIRDLYALQGWEKNYEVSHSIEVENGLYSLVIVANRMEKINVVEEIKLYLFKDSEAFNLKWDGIPTLYL